MMRRIPATLVPSITELRKSLGYGDSKDPRCQAFYDDVRAFRKKFITSNGTKGKDLHQWKEVSHQAGLKEMATAYLDTSGNGFLFWPTDPTMENYTGLVYADDYREITDLVIQLFFRLNLQQYRNEKYRGKGSTDTTTTDGRGMSTDDPIDVDADAPGSKPNSSVASDPPFVTGKFRVRSSTVESEASRNLLSQSQSSFSEQIHPELNHHTDDPDPDPDPDSRHDDAGDEQPTKKRRLDKRPDVEDTRSSKRSSKKRDSFIFTFKSRKSPRDARIRRDPELATEEMIREALASPTPTPMPSDEAGIKETQRSRSATAVAPTKHTQSTATAPVEEPQHPDTVPEASITVSGDAAKEAPSATSPVKQWAPVAPMMPPPPLPSPTPPAPPARPKPRVIFNYRVILSRSPCFEYVIWTPEGRFTDKTLSDIKKEIPLNLEVDPTAKGLLFTLLAPGVKIRIGIANGKDEQIAVMKREFDGAIRDQIPKATGSEPLYFDIEIEALRDEEQVKTEASRWEGELEW